MSRAAISAHPGPSEEVADVRELLLVHGCGLGQELDPLKNSETYDKFSRLLSELFKDRRKKLRKKLLQNSAPESAAHQWGDLRAEDLSPEDFWQIFRYTQGAK